MMRDLLDSIFAVDPHRAVGDAVERRGLTWLAFVVVGGAGVPHACWRDWRQQRSNGAGG
jgi:hypothetical protein